MTCSANSVHQPDLLRVAPVGLFTWRGNNKVSLHLGMICAILRVWKVIGKSSYSTGGLPRISLKKGGAFG